MEVGKKALDEIKEAFENAKEWVPIIYLPCSHLIQSPEGIITVGSNLDEKGTAKVSYIDIVKLMRMATDDINQVQNNLMSEHGYPEKALFRFGDCEGNGDRDKVKEQIFSAARGYGTELRTRSSSLNKQSKRQVSLILSL